MPEAENFNKLINHPGFIALPPQEQIRGLSAVSPMFNQLPLPEKQRALRSLFPSRYSTNIEESLPSEQEHISVTPPPYDVHTGYGKGKSEQYYEYLQKLRGASQESIEAEIRGIEADPFVDPVTAAAASVYLPAKTAFTGMRALGKPIARSAAEAIKKGMLSAGVSALFEFPIGAATDEIDKLDSRFALPFNIALGAASSITVERAVEDALLGMAGKKIPRETIKRVAKKVKAWGKEGDYEAVSKALKEVAERPTEGLPPARAAWREFFDPMSNVPEGKEYLKARYKSFGDIDTAERIVKKMHDGLKDYAPEVKTDIFRYLDGRLSLEDLPEGARKIAKSINERTKTAGRMLVKRGLISPEVFEKNRGKYVHYMYLKHILGDKADNLVTPTGKIDTSILKARKDLTIDEKKALGWIEDASIAVPVGMGKALNDVAKYDLLEFVGKNPNYVWTPSIVDVGGRKMGIGKLAEEVDIYSKMIKKHPDNIEIKQRYGDLKQALDRASEAARNIPGDFKQMPTTLSYGPLAGAYVRTPIYDDIVPLYNSFQKNEVGKMFNKVLNINEQGMRLFKATKAALNVPTATRNVISNVIQVNMSGRPLAKIPGDYAAAAKGMLTKDMDFKMARRHGLFRTNWAETEVRDVMDTFRAMEKGGFTWAKFMDKVGNLAKYYGKIDDFAKLAIYKQVRKQGMNVGDAILHAQKWGMDYSLASRSVKGLRRNIIPFLSYQYKIAPLIAETMRERPWIIAKYAAIPLIAAPIVAAKMNDMSNEEWNRMRKEIPSYIKENESYMISPWKSEKGNWQWMNMEYFFPWQNFLATTRDLKQGDYRELRKDFGIGNPFLSVLEGWGTGKDPFTGQPITNPLDSKGKQWLDRTEFVYKQWAPSMFTRKGAAGYTARIGEEVSYGREISPAQAAGRWFGLNLIETTPQQTIAEKKARKKELESFLYRKFRDKTISKEERKETIKRFQEQIKEIMQ